MLPVARQDMAENQENSRDHQPFTYIGSGICVESRIVDFKISFLSVDGPSFLKIEGIGAEISTKSIYLQK
jgi:hypothetical protein